MLSPEQQKYGLDEDLRDLNVAVVTDPIWSKNGGIDVIANITRFLEAPLYTLRQTEQPKPLEDVDVRRFGPEESLLQRTLRNRGLSRLFYLHQMMGYQYWNVPRDFDVVVTTGPLSQQVIQHPEQHRIHFFHSPARWLWDQTHDLWSDRLAPIRWIMRPYANQIRNTDATSTMRCEHLVANSDLVAERVESYYGRDSTVAYCPVDTFDYKHEPAEDYFVMANRIVPHKRVKLVVKAFNELDVPLKIAGDTRKNTADYAEECKEIADENVEFLGWVDGAEKIDLLANARGLVFAGEHEDFGMPPVEAMASGKPVVGVDEGFTKYQVAPGETGVLFQPNVSDLVAAVQRTTEAEWDEAQIQAAARTYDIRNTRATWQNVLRELERTPQ